MRTFLSTILLFLASLGFMAELIQLDKLSNIEFKAKENSESDENSEKSKKQKEIEEKIYFLADINLLNFFFCSDHSFYQAYYTSGFITNLYIPPDTL